MATPCIWLDLDLTLLANRNLRVLRQGLPRMAEETQRGKGNKNRKGETRLARRGATRE